MSKLKAKPPENIKREKPKVIVFGKAGAGKTWASLDFPNVYYIDTEGGATESQYVAKLKKSGGVYLGKKDGSQDFETIIEQVKALATEKHNYKTLVIDSLSNVFDIEVTKELERLTLAKTKIEFSIEKKPAVKFSKRLVGWLEQLDMNVILICHSADEYESVNGKNEKVGETYDGWKKLEYLLQLCLHVTKQGDSRKARVRKTRIAGFKDNEVINWSYEEFANRLGRDLLESEAKPVVLITPEQIAEITRLLSVVKLGDSAADKRIEDIRENLDEIDTEKAQNVITYLTKKLGV